MSSHFSAFPIRLLLGSICACGMFAAGCAKKQIASNAPKKPEVKVATAATKSVLDYEDFTGHTEAAKSVTIRARVTGHLDTIFFKDGQEVQEGDPLFLIDPRRLKATYEASEASVVQSEAHLKRLEDDLRRAQQVRNKKAISDEDYDKIIGDRNEAEAAVRVAKANRDQAKVDLSYCKIFAPISGQISRAGMDPHNLVKADDTPLTTIVKVDPIFVYFDVDERTWLGQMIKQGRLSRSDVVYVGLANETQEKEPSGNLGFPHIGKVNFIDNQMNIDTGTIRFRCEIPNPDRRIKPGMFARVRLPINQAHPAVVVPEQALGTDQGQKFAYVVDENDDVVYRSVKVGALQGSERVIHDGIKAGERVVVSGLQRVRPGIAVDPKPVEKGSK